MRKLKLKDILHKLSFNRIYIITLNEHQEIVKECFVAYKIDIENEYKEYKKEYDFSIDLMEEYGEYEIIDISLNNHIDISLVDE